jgi:hypothetical protein
MDTVSQEKLDYGKGILSSINTEILKWWRNQFNRMIKQPKYVLPTKKLQITKQRSNRTER